MPVTAFHSGHVWIGARTGSQESKSATWTKLGNVSAARLKPENDPKDIDGGAPGQIERLDVLHWKNKLSISVHLNQLDPFAWEFMLNCLPLTPGPSVLGVPNSGTASNRKVWAKLQLYNEENATSLIMEVWCYASITSDVELAGQNPVELDLELRVIRSSLNNFDLKNLA